MLSGRHNPGMRGANLSIKQPLRKLLHNSTFRMVLLYFILFILSSLILLSFIYWSSVGYIYKQLDQHIEYDMDRLQDIYNNTGMEALIEAIETSLKQKNYDSIYLLYNKKNHQIITGNLNKIPHIEKKGWYILDLSGITRSALKENHSARILVMPLPNNLILINGLDIESAHAQEHTIFNSLIAGIAIILLLGTLGGFIISISTIKKINLINDTINKISQGNLSLRIPSRGTDDDYDLLAKNINQMLNQIHQLMQGIQNISNNIAHDLRTPLTRLQSRLELIQQNCSHETAAGIKDALHETDNLLSTFNAMLRINKVESGADKGHFTQVSINALLNDVIEFYAPLADEKMISLQLLLTDQGNPSIDSRPYQIKGDRDMLFQVFTNILDNAIKYTPDKGSITVSTRFLKQKESTQLQIVIADSGIGIPEHEQEKVLEPFYRLEKHRDQQGNGLGLSLVSAIVKLHKGKIDFKDNAPGLGVSIILPLEETR